jgi:hypothetical protein
MKRKDKERIWRGVHPLRAWMLRMIGRATPWHPQDKARAVHGKHGEKSDRLHRVKRR